jgi:hypothetical protein
MTSRVIVRIKGKAGIDDVDRLLTDLAEETDLGWRHEHPEEANGARHLSGVGELLLTAVISGATGKGAEMAAEATLNRVREVIRRWRDRRLDPPDTEIETAELAEGEPSPGLQKVPAAGDAPGPR